MNLRAPLRGIDGLELALLEDYRRKARYQARKYPPCPRQRRSKWEAIRRYAEAFEVTLGRTTVGCYLTHNHGAQLATRFAGRESASPDRGNLEFNQP